MRKVTAYINSTEQDTRERWGVILEQSSLTALMTPPSMKDYISNESALTHGKQVLTNSGSLPKVADRDVQLTLGIEARSLAQFYMRYRSFCEELKKGVIDLTVLIEDGDTYIKETYHLLYLSCSQYSDYNGRLGKFVMKVNEPDPENRSVEHSDDIEI